ncbi:Arm DNA-binding domain-containing protein [Daejeonella sp.]
MLDTRWKKSDGTYPIMFRVTKTKELNYLSFGLSITEGDWDESNRCGP